MQSQFLGYVLRTLILVYASERVSDVTYAGVKSWGMECKGAIFSRVLQLLTCAIHEMLSTLSTGSALAVFISQLLSQEDSSCPSTLCALYDIKAALMTELSDKNTVFWIDWILDRISQNNDECKVYLSHRNKIQKDSERQVDLADKKRKARFVEAIIIYRR